MKFPHIISSVLGNFRFRKVIEKQKQKRELVGFNEAKKIGVLYDATDSSNFEIMKAYVKNIRSQQKEILALGYVNKKELPSNQYAQYGLDFFTRRHVDWMLIPRKNIIVQNFIS